MSSYAIDFLSTCLPKLTKGNYVDIYMALKLLINVLPTASPYGLKLHREQGAKGCFLRFLS
jgi:hypothetical protein